MNRRTFLVIFGLITSFLVLLWTHQSDVLVNIWFYFGILFLLTFIPIVILHNEVSFPSSLLIVPTLFLSFQHFFLNLGVENIYNFLDNTWSSMLFYHSLQKAMWLVVAGNLMLWIGFFSPFSKMMSRILRGKVQKWSLIQYNYKPIYLVIWVAFFLGVAVRLYMVKSGITGFFENTAANLGAQNYIQSLNLLAGLATLSLLVNFVCQLQSLKPNWFGVVVMLFFELGSLLFLGLKGYTVYRFYYLAVAYILVKKRFPFTLVLTGALVLVLITPVNLMMRMDYGLGKIKPGNVQDISHSFLHAWQQIYAKDEPFRIFGGQEEKQVAGSTMKWIFKDYAFLEIFSMVVQYTDATGKHFYGKDYWYPFYFWIPRILWPSKPGDADKGGFVATEIYRMPPGVSIGQTIPGDFYLNWGLGGILLGLFLLGMFQRVVGRILLDISCLRVLPLIPFLLFDLGVPDANLGPSIAGTIMRTVFQFIALGFMFRRVPE